MNDYMNNLPDPEEFWPDAEKMLNGHFQAKRRRRAAVLVSALLLFLTAVLYFNYNNETPVSADHSSPAQEQLSPTSTPEPATTAAENNVSVPSPSAGQPEVSSATGDAFTAAQAPVQEQHAPAVQMPLAEQEQVVAASDVTHKRHKKIVSSAPTESLSAGVVYPGTLSIPDATPPVKEGQHSVNTMTPVSTAPENTNELLTEVFPIRFLSAAGIRFPAADYPSISGLQEVKDAPKGKARYDIIAYAGLSYVDKVINSPGNTIYMQRRENEESATFLPYGGIQLAKSLNKLEIRAGAEFSVLGEKVNYSPYKNGTYYNSYLDWDPYSYSVTDTDSAWIFGMLFLQTSSYTVNDSIQVTKTDTLNGSHYDASILAANGTNRWYLIQFPIELSYQFKHGRFGVGLSGSVSPGFVVSSQGKYLLKDETGVKEISRDSKGTFMLNVGGGVEFSYLMGERFSLLLRPTFRYFLTPIEEENGASKNYRTYGIHAGIRYAIR